MGIVVQRESFGAVEQEWRDLLPSSSNSRVFLSPVWLRTWWESFGGGREMLLLSAREDGRLIGIAPLMRDGASFSFAGNTKVCDYMDFPCVAGREADLLSAVFRSLGEEPWDELRLWAMREDSAAVAALPTVCADLGLRFEKEQEDVCPRVELPVGWDTYLASLEKKHRHELKQKLRKLPQAGEVELEVLESPAEIEGAMDSFLWMLRESRSDKAAFMTEQMGGFFRRLIPALAAEGLAEMAFLKLGGRRVAAVICFRADGETLLYNSGYDPAYSAFSVGLLSKVLALQRAIDQGVSRFDFLRGHERYKYELGAEDLAVYRVTIRRAP